MIGHRLRCDRWHQSTRPSRSLSCCDQHRPPVIPTAPLDLSTPRRLHVVGVGGPGMSAIAIALAADGPQRLAAATSASSRCSTACVPRASTCTSATTRSHVVGCDAVTASTAMSPSSTSSSTRPANSASPTLRRAGMLASICAQAKSLAVAGTHGKTTTTSMLMLILAEAGLRPSFVIGGDVTDMGTGAQWTGGEWLVVEADESDGTHLELPLHGTILTNVEVDHLDHYGSLDAIERTASTATSPRSPGPKVVCADDPRRRARWPHGTTRSPTACRRRPTVRAVDVAAGARFVPLRRSSAPDGVLGHGSPAAARRCTTSSTRPARWRWRSRSASIRRWLPRRSARFGGVARRFDIRGHRRRRHVRRRLRPPADRDRRRARAPRATAATAGSRVVAVFQPNRYNRMAEMWREYADAFVGGRRRRAHRHLPVGHRRRSPASPASSSSTPCSTRTPSTRVVWLPRRDDLVDYLAGERRRRRRVHLDGMRRHRLAARRGARRRGPRGAAARPDARRRSGRGGRRAPARGVSADGFAETCRWRR